MGALPEHRETPPLIVEGQELHRLGPAPEIATEARGTYALLLRLEQPTRLQIGRLGWSDLPAGLYVYCGSALGGLRARVARHLRAEKRRHWHVDYLLAEARVLDVWVAESPVRLECALASHLAALPGASRPPGFGASDCRCPGHLVHLPSWPFGPLGDDPV